MCVHNVSFTSVWGWAPQLGAGKTVTDWNRLTAGAQQVSTVNKKLCKLKQNDCWASSYTMYYTGCFKKSSPPLKLFGIFSLWLSLFAWNFAYLLAIHAYLPHPWISTTSMDIYHIHAYLPHPCISTTSMHIYHIHAYLPYFCRFILIFHQMALNFYRFHLVRFWVFTQKMKMQWSSFSEMT